MFTTTNFLDRELDIELSFHKGCPGDHFTPPDPDYWEVEKVEIDGRDITEAINRLDRRSHGRIWERLEYQVNEEMRKRE